MVALLRAKAIMAALCKPLIPIKHQS